MRHGDRHYEKSGEEPGATQSNSLARTMAAPLTYQLWKSTLLYLNSGKN